MKGVAETRAGSELYAAFYTMGTRYEQEAARLQASLKALGLPHEIHGVPDRGSWVANTRFTAHFMLQLLQAHPDRPVVYLDADAVVWRTPTLFCELRCDVAAHYAEGLGRPTHLLNGTVFLAPTPAALEVVRKYARLIDERPAEQDEQAMLQLAIEQTPTARVDRLPASYCWIHDLMQDRLDGEGPVIEHLQASREADGRRSRRTENRLRRLREIQDRFPTQPRAP